MTTRVSLRVIIEHKDYKCLWRKRTTEDGEPINHNQVVRAHGEKVFDTIKLAITSIDDLKGLSQTLSQMGYEHYKLGVRSEHYQVSPASAQQSAFFYSP